jgi:hypothetical protein
MNARTEVKTEILQFRTFVVILVEPCRLLGQGQFADSIMMSYSGK